jgi:hypothetical protein
MIKLDLVGQKFNRLLCLKELDATVTGRRRGLFLCDCGRHLEAVLSAVKCGSTKSCGCLRVETSKASRKRDLTGRRFGRLLVTSQAGNSGPKNEADWHCLCDCGNTTTGKTGQLNYGRKESCGCIRVEQMRALGLANRQDNPYSRSAEYQAAKKRRYRARPAYAMAERVSRLVAWALASVGAIKKSATFDMLGYTPAALKSHLEKQFTKGMSWDNRAEWQVDHIIPISTARCEADVITLNQLSNLRPMWSKQNTSKGSRRHHLL